MFYQNEVIKSVETIDVGTTPSKNAQRHGSLLPNNIRCIIVSLSDSGKAKSWSMVLILKMCKSIQNRYFSQNVGTSNKFYNQCEVRILRIREQLGHNASLKSKTQFDFYNWWHCMRKAMNKACTDIYKWNIDINTYDI